jgi:N-carbamoyl-D-amino-acid hydrolase
VFPELALTTFFPRWFTAGAGGRRRLLRARDAGPGDAAAVRRGARPGRRLHLGYAELAQEAGRTRRFNTAITVDKGGRIVGKYRKIHLPGHAEHEPWRRFQHLEKRYFEVGDLGFPGLPRQLRRRREGILGMAICNDRRWPETYRILGLQAVEMVLIGYNTPVHNPPAPEHDALSHFHNELVMQSGAYQNGTWVVGVAKAGNEEGVEQIGNSIIVAPSGEIVAACTTTGDELAIARCDLDLCASYKNTTFNFARHREPAQYRMIVERKGAVPPAGGFVPQERRERLGVLVDRIEPGVREAFAEISRREGLPHGSLQRADCLNGRARRCEQSVPRLPDELRNALFIRCRQIRVRARPDAAGAGKKLQLSRLDMGCNDRDVGQPEVHPAGSHIEHRRRGALVGHVNDIESGRQLERLDGNLGQCRTGGVRQLARMLPSVSDEFRQGRNRQISSRRQHQRCAGDAGNRNEVALRVVAQAAVDRRSKGQVAAAAQQQRVAVRLGARNVFDADRSAGPRPVLDNHRNAEQRAKGCRNQARDQVALTARWIAHDQLDRLGGIGLGQ